MGWLKNASLFGAASMVTMSVPGIVVLAGQAGAATATSVASATATSVARSPITRPAAGVETPDPLSEQREIVAIAVTRLGYYTEPGAGVSTKDLSRVQRRLVSAGDEIGVVMLSTTQPQLKAFANEVLDLVRGKGSKLTTIVVLTPTELAGSSRRFTNLDEGLAASLPVFERDVVGGFEELHTALTGGPLPAGGKEPEEPSSVPWPIVFGGGGLLLAAIAVILALRSGRVRTPHSDAV